MGDTVHQQSPDPVVELIRREIGEVVQKSFLIYLVTAFLVVVTVGTISLLFVGGVYPWTGYQEILDFVVAAYAGAVLLVVRLKSSRNLGTHFYALGILGLCLGGFLYAWGGYSLLGAGYHERQASKNLRCKCWRDSADLVVVGGETLACSKCSRRIRIGFDVPRLWSKLGLVAVPLGIALLVLNSIVPGIEGELLNYLGDLLIFDGLVLGVLPFTVEGSMGGYVRLPPNQQESTATTPR